MFSTTWDRTSYAMEARILRPLLWFGLDRFAEVPPGSGGRKDGSQHFLAFQQAFFPKVGTPVGLDFT
jgi:hypothetical protein